MSSLRPGDMLNGRYRIGPIIARGGMSTVYRATDTRLGRDVAAKVMNPKYNNDAGFRTRLEREAHAAARLHGPNIVNVYDQDDDGEHVFLIMELVDGGTLRELLTERGPMPPHAAFAVLEPVLEALATAHRAGLVHRDIKPENILIDTNGQVKLTDFGLVRARAESGLTQDSVILGTAAYLAPEQVDGGDITPASDVYSAGMVLYELLTDETPFTGDTSLAIALQRVMQDVPSPSATMPGIPSLVDALVGRATARDPRERFSDAAEFAEALRDVAQELQLPRFRVPTPSDTAAGRAEDAAAAASTDVAGAAATTKIDPDRDYAAWAEPATGLFETQVAPAVQPGAVAPIPHATDNEDLPQVPHETEMAPAPARPPRSRTQIGCAMWLVIALILATLVGTGAWWVGSGRYGEIPQVYGLSTEQALARVDSAGFTAAEEHVWHDTVAQNQVAGTDPPFGGRAQRGSEVSVLVSKGKPTVPAIPTDAALEQYRSVVEDRSLTIAEGDAVYSDSVPAGKVATVEPAPGTEVKVGSTVTVHSSKGPAPTKVPDVSGATPEAAREILVKAGLKPTGPSKSFAKDVKPGQVIKTDPVAGTGLAKDSPVEVIVNNAIEVPDVTGLPEAEAREKLTAAGLTVTAVQTTSDTKLFDGAVVETSPKSGELVDPDSPRVDLVVTDRVKVPWMIGKSVADATKMLEELGLKASLASGSDPDGVVFFQSPLASRTVSKGDTVSLSTF